MCVLSIKQTSKITRRYLRDMCAVYYTSQTCISEFYKPLSLFFLRFTKTYCVDEMFALALFILYIHDAGNDRINNGTLYDIVINYLLCALYYLVVYNTKRSIRPSYSKKKKKDIKEQQKSRINF